MMAGLQEHLVGAKTQQERRVLELEIKLSSQQQLIDTLIGQLNVRNEENALMLRRLLDINAPALRLRMDTREDAGGYQPPPLAMPGLAGVDLRTPPDVAGQINARRAMRDGLAPGMADFALPLPPSLTREPEPPAPGYDLGDMQDLSFEDPGDAAADKMGIAHDSQGAVVYER